MPRETTLGFIYPVLVFSSLIDLYDAQPHDNLLRLTNQRIITGLHGKVILHILSRIPAYTLASLATPLPLVRGKYVTKD